MQSEHLPVCKDRPRHSQDQDLEGCHSLPLQWGQNCYTSDSLYCDMMQWVSDYISFIHCFLHFSSGRGYCKWFYYCCTNCPMTLIYNACCMEYKCSHLQADAEAFIVHKALLLTCNDIDILQWWRGYFHVDNCLNGPWSSREGSSSRICIMYNADVDSRMSHGI